MKKILFLFLVFGLLLADIGPSPNPPDITVHLTYEDLAYDGYLELTYRCINDDLVYGDEDNIMDERDVEFACTEGTCYNTYWFYKLNSCFSGQDGYFTYEIQGEGMTSDHIVFEQEKSYNIYLELLSGNIYTESGNNGNDGNGSGSCPLTMGFLLLPLIGILVKR